ncbi:hypothetical protein BAE44_0009442 [Dichanthelium oligosanthes]|uniref:F-box domain-containing protein n=1 Tax=Dichanthelium oligosanthes TaxID=888268 RepID=A0A1E5VWP4_9POAL|nr:hypothetical protein BAE44_0009442 [Dichanthelium oligosanthes]
MAAHVSSLTDDTLAEILARLPPRSIGRCCAVCRAWNAITSHPSVDRVLAKRPAGVSAIMRDCKLSSLDLDDMTISTVAFRSWDGVLCTRAFPRKPQPHHSGTDYYMNPLTDACAVVSAPAGQGQIIGGYAHPVTGGFHLLHSTDVTVSGDRDLVVPITVRTLRVGDGTGWREVPLPFVAIMRGERNHSVSLHGNLQGWLF